MRSSQTLELLLMHAFSENSMPSDLRGVGEDTWQVEKS